jgi:hypothetical protein
MELKTYKEFKSGALKPPILEKEIIQEKEEEKEKITYLLQHPDSEWVKDGFYEINEISLEIKDGCVIVEDEIKNILLSRGFVLLKKLEKDKE